MPYVETTFIRTSQAKALGPSVLDGHATNFDTVDGRLVTPRTCRVLALTYSVGHVHAGYEGGTRRGDGDLRSSVSVAGMSSLCHGAAGGLAADQHRGTGCIATVSCRRTIIIENRGIYHHGDVLGYLMHVGEPALQVVFPP